MPTNAQGFSEKLLLGIETSFKTLPGTPKAVRIPVINPAIKLNVQRFRSEALTGSPEPRPVVDGKQEVSGNYELECSKHSLMVPLCGLFGSAGMSTFGTATAYDHYFTLSALDSFYAEQQHLDINQYLLWKGLRHGKTSFKFDAEGLMKASFDVMGGNQAIGGAGATAGGHIRDDTGADPFDYTKGSIKYGGSNVAYFQSMTVDIDRQIEKVIAIDGTVEVTDIISKIAMVKGTVKALFRDASLISDSINSVETSLEILLTSGSSGHGMRIFLPTVKFMPTSPSTAGQGLVTVDLTFDAYARGSASDVAARSSTKSFVTVTVVTGVSDTLGIVVDGAASQPFTLSAGALTPAGLVTALAGLTGATAFVENGRVVVQSATKGSTSSVALTGNALTLLGWDGSSQVGFDAKSIVIQLTNDVQSVLPIA